MKDSITEIAHRRAAVAVAENGKGRTVSLVIVAAAEAEPVAGQNADRFIRPCAQAADEGEASFPLLLCPEGGKDVIVVVLTAQRGIKHISEDPGRRQGTGPDAKQGRDEDSF